MFSNRMRKQWSIVDMPSLFLCFFLWVGLVTKPWPWICTADVGRGWQEPRCTSRCCLWGFLGDLHTSCEAIFPTVCRGGETGLCGAVTLLRSYWALSLGHKILFAMGGHRGSRERGSGILLFWQEAWLGRALGQRYMRMDDFSEHLLAHPEPSFIGQLYSFSHYYLNLMEKYYHRETKLLCLSATRPPQASRFLEPWSWTSNLSSGGLIAEQRSGPSSCYCFSYPLP